jgi:hypothetical protein
VRAEAAKEIGVERLEVEAVEEATEVGHVGELARGVYSEGEVGWTPTAFWVY